MGCINILIRLVPIYLGVTNSFMFELRTTIFKTRKCFLVSGLLFWLVLKLCIVLDRNFFTCSNDFEYNIVLQSIYIILNLALSFKLNCTKVKINVGYLI